MFLNFSKSLLFQTSHLTKIRPYHLQTMLTKKHGNQVNQSTRFRITLNKFIEKLTKVYVRLYLCNAFSAYSYSEAYSDQPFLCYDNHDLRFWCYLHSFGTMPSSYQEIWKVAIFTYNVWTIWPKITRMVSLHSEQHAELNRTQFSHVSHFWASAIFNFDKKCYILRTHWWIIMKLVMCLQDHSLKVLKKFCGSTTVWSKIIMTFQKTLILLIIFAYCHESCLHRFLWSSQEHW